jgi:hypothetical protein
MTQAHLWTWLNWILLGLNVSAEAVVLWLAISRKLHRRLIMLPVFAAFCLLVDISGTVFAFNAPVDIGSGGLRTSHLYWNFYWSGQILSGVIVLFLALQIITVILPPWDRLITLLGLIAFMVLAVIYFKLLPTTKASDVLTIVTLADVITVLSLPIIGVIKLSVWPKGMKLIASGLVVSLVLQAGCTALAGVRNTMVGIVSIGVPFSALVGMGFFLAALLGIQGNIEYKELSGVSYAVRVRKL